MVEALLGGIHGHVAGGCLPTALLLRHSCAPGSGQSRLQRQPVPQLDVRWQVDYLVPVRWIPADGGSFGLARVHCSDLERIEIALVQLDT